MINKFLNKYRSMSEPVKASIWFTICNFLNKGIALLSTPILTRLMNTEQYGLFSVYQSWISIVTIICTLNIFSSAFTTALIHNEKQRNIITSSLLGLTTFISFFWFIILLVFKKQVSSFMGLPIYLIIPMFLQVALISAFEFWMAKERFNYKYRKLVVLSVIMNVLSIAFGISAILITNFKAEARIFTDVFVKCVIGLILYVSLMMKGKCFFNKKYWKYALVFSVPLIPHFFSHFILGHADRLMISSICGKSYAAIYSVAYSISMMMILVVNAINNSFTPYVYKKMKQDQVKGIIKVTNILFILVAMLCFLAISLAPELIKIFASKDYADAVWIVPPVASSVFFIFVYSMFSNIEYFYGKTSGISIASLGSALINIVLNYVFINRFGFLAAGYTTLFSYILLALFHYYLYKRVVDKERCNSIPIFDIKFIINMSLLVVIVMFIMIYIYNYTFIRYLFIMFIILMIYTKRRILIKAINLKDHEI